MTAAEVVETSVTTINSLLQDFTNLDDQSSQTLTDTPGFKPFNWLRSLWWYFEQHANNYIHFASNVRCVRQQPWFNHRCKDLGLVPVGLRIRSPVNTQKAIHIVNSTSRRLIRARIYDCHKRLNHYKNKQPQRLERLQHIKTRKWQKRDDNCIKNISSRQLDETETQVLWYGLKQYITHRRIQIYTVVSNVEAVSSKRLGIVNQRRDQPQYVRTI